jgi:hypothetical protein
MRENSKQYISQFEDFHEIEAVSIKREMLRATSERNV